MPELPPTAAATTPGAVVGSSPSAGATAARTPPPATAPGEIGGPPGPEPTRYGDWEKNGRCIDF